MTDKAIIIESTKNMLRATKLFSDSDIALLDQMDGAEPAAIIGTVEKPLVTINEICGILGLSYSSVRNLVDKGIFKHARGCKKPYRYPIEQVKRYMRGESVRRTAR